MPFDIRFIGALPLDLTLVVLACSIVQSVMGVGLLLFGTPTLLLLGMNFGETLAVLLPCSVTVNLCQLHGGLPRNRQATYRIACVTLPMVFIGLVIALQDVNTRWMPLAVGTALLALGVFRLSCRATGWLNRAMASYQHVYLSVMGLVHGLSNMGGGLLVAYSSTLPGGKEEIRRTIALGYLAFALTQLSTLALHRPDHFRSEYLAFPVISLVAYLAGNRVFQRLSAGQFERMVTGFILTYGVVTVSKAV